MIEIILFVFVYLILGIITLELVLLHDRHSEWIDCWLIDESEDMQVLCVLLFPLVLILLIMWAIGKGLVWFIKTVRVAFTSIVYVIIGIFKVEGVKNVKYQRNNVRTNKKRN